MLKIRHEFPPQQRRDFHKAVDAIMANVELEEATRVSRTYRIMAKNLRDRAAARSPWLYGVLSKSHRWRYERGVYGFGLGVAHITLDIDPDIEHPILGGKPVEYGPEVHDRKPWFYGWTIDQEWPEIKSRTLKEVEQIFVDAWEHGRR